MTHTGTTASPDGRGLRSDSLYWGKALVSFIPHHAYPRSVTPVYLPLRAELLIREDRLVGHHTGQGVSEKPAPDERVQDGLGHPKFVPRLLSA